MILTQIDQKVLNFQEVFSYPELAFNPNLKKDTESLINQYQAEKQKEYSKIETIYTVQTKTTRVYDGIKKSKSFFPSHKIQGNWKGGIGEINQWLPYRNQDIKHVNEGQLILIHEGEKATDYARYHGLISFSFLGAKCQDEDFIESQLQWLKSQGLSGAIYLEDNDKVGADKGLKLLKIANKIDFPLLSVPVAKFYPQAEKGDDLVDFIQYSENTLKSLIGEIPENHYKRFLEKFLEENLEEIIEDNIERLKSIKLSLDQAKEILEKLFQSDLESDDLLIQIEKLYERIEGKLSKTTWSKLIKSVQSKYRHDRVKLEIQRYLQEGDRLKQVDIKNQVCSNYGYSTKDFYDLVAYIDDLERTPYKQIWSIKDLVDHAQQLESWLLPSFLPVGELLLLTAAPKVGKSLLATEITNKVLTGGEFLGEKVKQGSVLYCFSDESPRDFGNRIFNLGLDLPEILPNQNQLIGLSYFDILRLKELEKWLEDYRPSLVIFDSLTSISQKLGINENDAQFAQYIYRLKDILKKYNTSGILIHHDNKNGEASGSLRIEAAVWGSAQLTTQGGAIADDSDETEDSDITNSFDNIWTEDYRILKLKRARSTEPNSWKLLLNPTQQWIEKGIYDFCGEENDQSGQKREAVEKLSLFLENNCDVWLEVEEIYQCLGIPTATLYRSLSKLERTSKIKKRRSTANCRKWVYQWAKNSQQSEYNTADNHSQDISKIFTPPPSRESENEHENKPQSQSPSESQLILTSFSQEENENEMRMAESVDITGSQAINSHSHVDSHGGGVEKKEDVTPSECYESGNIGYCEKFPNSIKGIKVTHTETPEIEGVIISEPEKLGINFTVKVRWSKMRINDTKWFDSLGIDLEKDGEPCWVTSLISEEIDFQAWRENKLNGN